MSHPCGIDAAVYALGALEAAEAAAFEAHLSTCVVCRDELAAFQDTASVLALAAEPVAVPNRLRRRVLAEVRSDAAVQARRRTVSVRPERRRIAFARPAIGLASVAVIALAAAGGIDLVAGGTSTRIYRAAVTGTGRAELRVSGTRADLVLNRLPQPPSGKIYEVWLQRGATKKPTGTLFSVTAKGATDIEVPGNLRGVSNVLVTVEPQGGSPAPTTNPVIDAALS